jgi:hypothetical protein
VADQRLSAPGDCRRPSIIRNQADQVADRPEDIDWLNPATRQTQETWKDPDQMPNLLIISPTRARPSSLETDVMIEKLPACQPSRFRFTI